MFRYVTTSSQAVVRALHASLKTPSPAIAHVFQSTLRSCISVDRTLHMGPGGAMPTFFEVEPTLLMLPCIVFK